MTILVTGASGFVGRFLVPNLLNNGRQVVCLGKVDDSLTYQSQIVPILGIDLNDRENLDRLIRQHQVTIAIHLAGVAHQVDASRDRDALFETNVAAAYQLGSSLLANKNGVDPYLLFVSSALVFGRPEQGEVIFKESTPVNPVGPYACSKLAAEFALRSLVDGGLKLGVARPCNHIGPGQAEHFVCPSLARRIANIDGDRGTIEVGNLAARRDFCDVRDIINAYGLMVEKQAEGLYVLGTGRGITIGEILQSLSLIAGKQVDHRVNPDFLRGNEAKSIVTDSSRASRDLGWHAKIPIKQTLEDVYRSITGG